MNNHSFSLLNEISFSRVLEQIDSKNLATIPTNVNSETLLRREDYRVKHAIEECLQRVRSGVLHNDHLGKTKFLAGRSHIVRSFQCRYFVITGCLTHVVT